MDRIVQEDNDLWVMGPQQISSEFEKSDQNIKQNDDENGDRGQLDNFDGE